jgi:hypothetical protein
MDSTVTISGLGVVALVGVGFAMRWVCRYVAPFGNLSFSVRKLDANSDSPPFASAKTVDELDVPLRRDVAIPRNVGHADRRSEPMAEGFVRRQAARKPILRHARGR